MAAEGVHRLSKVAKELNVSVSTLSDFLNANGSKVESNPNHKITDAQYALVRKEYEGEKKQRMKLYLSRKKKRLFSQKRKLKKRLWKFL